MKVVATFPTDSHAPIEYPAAIVTGHNNPESEAFLAYLKSDEAKAIFQKFGFMVK